MRKDPPFDAEYIYATHLLEQAEREGARVVNKPRALRDHPEKLAIMEFAEFTTPTLVTRDAAAVRAFHAEHQDIILKPLDGMGGMGIFRVKADGAEPRLDRRDAQQERRRNHHGAALRARDHAGRQAHPRDRRPSRCPTAWRAFRRAPRCAATSRPAARAWRSR